MIKKLALVVGARPNFMKAAPLVRELKKYPDRFDFKLIHTGQHYDYNLSKLFFEHLKMPEPDIFLGVGSGTHAVQTGNIMVKLEKILKEFRPDLVMVFGDVNSTLAGAVAAKKIHIKVAHVEAGLRSFDMSMPEEINRIVTDKVSDFHFVTEKSGVVNLKREGIHDESIFLVGNIMIDSLIHSLEFARNSDILSRLSLEPKKYIAMTLHRPANVDNENSLRKLMKGIVKIGRRLPIVFPCHPRTKKKMEEFGLTDEPYKRDLLLIEPLGYLDFLKIQSESRLVLTDSGGIQEETTFLKIPCVTMRKNTERPVTVEIGSNIIAGTEPDNIVKTALDIIDGKVKESGIPELWDGRTAERIVEILLGDWKWDYGPDGGYDL